VTLLLKRRGGEGKGGERRGEGTPPNGNSWIRPWVQSRDGAELRRYLNILLASMHMCHIDEIASVKITAVVVPRSPFCRLIALSHARRYSNITSSSISTVERNDPMKSYNIPRRFTAPVSLVVSFGPSSSLAETVGGRLYRVAREKCNIRVYVHGFTGIV